MAVTAAAVKELREKTGVGMMDCKKALVETDGDFDKAIDFLREKGLASAKKKSGRATGEGLVASYIHQGGKVGVLVDISCETDFVAKTDDFITLINDVAMHIAAASPAYIDRESVPSEIIEKEKEIFTAQMKEEGKPEQVIDKIVTGKIDKFYKENCLLEQEFVKDPDKTINDLVSTAIAKLGENIKIKQFARFKVGEGEGSSSDEGSEGDNE